MTPIVSFVGKSNSGKTTLLEKVVRELKSKGYRVAVIKHSPHGFDIDQPGKDTWRLAQAGSDVVAISAPNKVALIERVDADVSLSQIEALIANKVDIILIEGYKNGNTAKILVLDSEGSKPQFCGDGETLATVSARLSSVGEPQFADEDVSSIMNLVIEQINENSPRKFEDVSRGADFISGCNTRRVRQLEKLLAESAAFHGHVCPGQVIGVRMARRGCQELGIERPREESKRLVTYVEIDRCAADAIQFVTGCQLGKRTLKHVDYGKLAATFVDLHTGQAVRVVAREDAQEKAALWHHQELTKHEAEVLAYQEMSDEELFHIEHVIVPIPVEDMPGPPLRRVICEQCGEGVNDCREVTVAGEVLCRACAYGCYYQRYDALAKELVTTGASSGWHTEGTRPRRRANK